ncbi:MAG TPA: MATE family efflux transporter [Sphingobacterium sp.]|nr:MATE family efflux transporter [Sphingobacterium sp.]
MHFISFYTAILYSVVSNFYRKFADIFSSPYTMFGSKTHKSYYLSTLMLAGPIVISQLGHVLVQTIDTMIVGHFAGTIPLAAVSLAHSVFMIILVIGIGFAYGLTPLIAQNSRKNKEHCAKLLSNSLWINIICSILLFFTVFYGSVYVMEHSNQDPAVIKEAKPYLLILSISILPLMVFNTFKQFAEGLGFTKQAMNISIWGNVINIILAVIFVRGMFGIPPMGTKGVGLAALIDRSIMMVAMTAYVMKAGYFKPYMQHFRLWYLKRKEGLSIIKIGAPVALQYVFEVGAFAGAALIAGKIGAIEQASHQVAMTFAAMTYMMGSGLSSAATIKVGNSYGGQNYYRIREFARVSYHIIIIAMTFTAVIFAGFHRYLPFLMTSDLNVVYVAAQLLLIAAFFQLFDGVQVIGLGVLRGMGDVYIPTIISFIAYWLIGLPIAYFLGLKTSLGINGVWYGLTIGLLSSSLLLYIRYRLTIKRVTA